MNTPTGAHDWYTHPHYLRLTPAGLWRHCDSPGYDTPARQLSELPHIPQPGRPADAPRIH